MELSAASRLVSDAAGPRMHAARRMITAAAVHGIDLSLMWATVERAPGRGARARQVCLAVPVAGRTVMLMVSGPGGITGANADAQADQVERVACINAAGEHFASSARDVHLLQALPEPQEPWAVEAFRVAGFIHVGDLAYLRRPLLPPLLAPPPSWPAGIAVRTLEGSAARGEPDRQRLLEALSASYVDTLDCPELCGLRDTEDILESHRATGRFDPRLWWLVFRDGRPEGCMLLSQCADHGSVELVYLGLSPALRGRSLGSALLRMGLARLVSVAAEHVTCAVDLRNVPARRVYERAGFGEFGRRVALVRRVRRGAAN